jgi:hypothetical protein
MASLCDTPGKGWAAKKDGAGRAIRVHAASLDPFTGFILPISDA